MNVLKSYSLIKETDELKKLILENPDLPIVVLAGENANDGYYGWMYCSSISFGIDEILDCDFRDYDDVMFTDRDRLEEYIGDMLYDKYSEKSDEEFDAIVKENLKRYEPYWTKVIAIWANN